ncbi:MAG: hypothetical protein H0T84_08570 [Tatlockia sp.]|nr:hypothetical protein [Tatlockia sp.]
MDIIINGEKDAFPLESNALSGQADYYHRILDCLGYEPEHQPLANLLKLYHGLEGNWVIASPVHWEASHNDAMLTAAGRELELSDEESRLWFKEVSDFLKADGFTPVYHDACTWLFKIDDKPKISSQSVQTLLHHSLMPVFSSLDSSIYWQRLLTELQMYLSAHPLNLKRNELTINGLWFWGEGAFELKGRRVIISDDEVLLNYANATESAIIPMTSTTLFSKAQLVIINEPKQIEICRLSEKIKKNTVNWYWNNCSYSSQAASWWSRLWG